MRRGLLLSLALLLFEAGNLFAGMTDTGRCDSGECVNRAISRWQSQQIRIRDIYRGGDRFYPPGVYGAFVFARATVNSKLVYKWAYSAGEKQSTIAKQQAVLTFEGAPGEAIDMVTWNYSIER